MRLMIAPSIENSAPCAFPLIRGVDTFVKIKKPLYEIDHDNSAILVRPGKSIKFNFDDQVYDGFQKFLSDLKWQGNFSEVKIYVSRITFEDGTIWAKGSEVVPDPENARRLIPIKEYFASNNYEYKNAHRTYFAKPIVMKYSNLKKVASSRFDSDCTRAAEVYLEYCSPNGEYQCSKETYTPYQNGEIKWQWAYVPCIDERGYYCSSYAYVKEVTYDACN